MDNAQNKSQLIIYQTEDGQTKIQVKMEDETVWLTQDQMAELFEKSKSTINEHIKNIYEEKELDEGPTMRKFGISEFSTKPRNYYNLDVIISVGYRVKSLRGTQFRIWATQRLKEYIIKGFALDDERLKQGGEKARYFQELLQRIRDIRSSERNFYQKVTDIYATSIDYRKDNKLTAEFFATVQNKMHYAVHGHAAAEIIDRRADSTKPLMGLTNFKGNYITAQDIKIAKNYLNADELKRLNLIVSLYLDFAELQATNGRLMKMNDWIEKLDQFLKLSEHELLTHAGKVSAEQAIEKAESEFNKYKKDRDKDYISDFDRATKAIEQKAAKRLPKKKGRENG
ncbi:virulence RhuM family protein [Candidatus Kuenenia sp.]|uniref:virulence RhuM family protein n=1 Tax=Candidatus Kuenenia sp. TaxID=2499824 RepID=UPI003220656D